MKKIIIIVFLLMMNAFLFSNNNASTDVKEINSSQVKEMLFGNTKNNVDYNFKGTIKSLDYSKNTGSLVVAELDKKSLNLYLFKNNGMLKWKKNISNSSGNPYIYMSDNSEIIVVNYILDIDSDDNVIFINLVLDNKGNIISKKKTYDLYNVSPNGKYIFTICRNYDVDPLKNIEVYDPALKKINLRGFISDESIITYTFLSDTLIYVERAYKDRINSYVDNKDKITTEFYTLSNNSLKKIKTYTKIEKNFDMIGFNVNLWNNDIQLINNKIYNFRNRVIYDHNANIIKQYDGVHISVSENDEIILKKQNDLSDLKLIKKDKSEKKLDKKLRSLNIHYNFLIHNSIIIMSYKKDLENLRFTSLYNQLTNDTFKFNGRIIIDQNRFIIITEKKISFGEIK